MNSRDKKIAKKHRKTTSRLKRLHADGLAKQVSLKNSRRRRKIEVTDASNLTK
jgi:hypothetical protein